MRAPFLIIFVAAQEISPILLFMAKPDLKPIFTVVALTILFILNPAYAFSKDITKQVINETPLDEQITFFCLMYCIGNERKGTLKSVTVNPTANNNRYTVRGKAALLNRQVVRSPLKFTVYDQTVIVNAIGTLNSENCELRVDDVIVENDFQNIVTNLLKSQSDVIGKVVVVPNCKKVSQLAGMSRTHCVFIYNLLLPILVCKY